MLEGKFQSFYDGRVSKSIADSLISYGIPFINKSEKDGKMIVVADGDIATNQVSPQQGPMPMVYNFFMRHTFAYKDFQYTLVKSDLDDIEKICVVFFWWEYLGRKTKWRKTSNPEWS